MRRSQSLSVLAVVMATAFVCFTVEADEPRVSKEPVREDLVRRYGVQSDLKRYAQDNPRQAIYSIVQSVAGGDIEYMLAHLISPTQVDAKLKGDRQAFRKLVVKATPDKSKRLVAALRRQLEDGTWTIQRDAAWAQAEGVPLLSMEKLGKRWFMHNVPKPLPKPPPKQTAARPRTVRR